MLIEVDGLLRRFGRWTKPKDNEMSETIVSLGVLLYNFLLVAGTAWLIAFYDWSMWTFLLTVCFITSRTTVKNKE